MTTLPNRAELRLKDVDRVIGYTLSQVRDDQGAAIGAVMFFKDLTHVEQREERERLRDRLASLGEMAAGIAHELKNPLGRHRGHGLACCGRQVSELPDAQVARRRHPQRSQAREFDCGRMLEFVRPIRLQVEQTDVAEVLHQAVTTAESKATRGNVDLKLSIDRSLPAGRRRSQPALSGVYHQPADRMRSKRLTGRGTVEINAAVQLMEQDPPFTTDSPALRPHARRRSR
jgi:nitrogen-specific signal transduction histidine kinase